MFNPSNNDVIFEELLKNDFQLFFFKVVSDALVMFVVLQMYLD